MESDLSSLSSLTDDLNAELQSSQSTLSAYTTLAGEDSTDEEIPAFDDVAEGDEADVGESEDEKPSFEADTGVVRIVADTREGNSSVIRRLDLTDGLDVEMVQLSVGDYILSDRVAVERKSAQDFADTLVEGRRSMFEQLGALVNNYERPVLVLEGTQDELYDARNIHPNAIRGALQSLAVDYGVSVLWARDEEETAHHLSNIAIREQTDRDRTVQVHGKKGGSSTSDQQEYIISAIADVGLVTAQALLAGLGSVRAVFTADEAELQTVDGVGAVTAERIVAISTIEYNPAEEN
jgi:Fanconi anemia group M protein